MIGGYRGEHARDRCFKNVAELGERRETADEKKERALKRKAAKIRSTGPTDV